MTKAELIQKVAHETGIERVDVHQVFEACLAGIKQALGEGETLYIRGFGSFQARKRSAKVGYNFKHKSPINLEERIIPHFKPSKIFQAELNGQPISGDDY
ncbi:MAG: integration host factor subunit beta [Sphingomonadales bacterium]|nr:integration host factor subunit beta [Sphingomonadales bacterium]